MTSGLFEFSSRLAGRKLATFLIGGCSFAAGAVGQTAHSTHKSPLDYVNGLVGTAPLDRQELIGNAPPPGERLYSGMTSPEPRCRMARDLGPINRNVDLTYGAGVRTPTSIPIAP